MKGGVIPFVDDDSDDAGLMYDDIGGVAPSKPLKEAVEAPANNALPDLTPEPSKKKSGKDVLGVTVKKVRPKFTENDLAKDNGLEWLPKHAPKRARFRGKDDALDARRLVDTYRSWSKQLFPSVPLDELLQHTDNFGHKMFVRGLVENLRDLQRREVRLAKRRAAGEEIEDVIGEQPKASLVDKKAAALALKAKKAADRQAQLELDEMMAQRADVIDEEGEALMDMMDEDMGGPPAPRRPAAPPKPADDDLDAAMAAFDAAAAPPAVPQDDAAAPPTQMVPEAQDAAMDAAPTQLVPPSQACDLPGESALEFNSQPSQVSQGAEEEEEEFQF